MPIETYFTGSLTTANAAINQVTDRPIIGQIRAIEWDSGNWTNGSMFIITSGAIFDNRVIATYTGISGTAASIRYPAINCVDISGTALSGAVTGFNLFVPPVTFEYLTIGVSCCGSTTAGTTGYVRVYWDSQNH